MVKSDRVLQAILLRCTLAEPAEWRLNLSAANFTHRLTAEESSKWPNSLVEGHILLLEDGGFVKLHPGGSEPAIRRVTLAGHELLERLQEKHALRDNPFFRQ